MSDTKDTASNAPETTSLALPLELDEFSERCMGNAAIATMLLEKFEVQLHGDLDQLAQGLAAGDGEQLASTAHGLKGAAAALAASSIRALAAEIEALARNGSLDAIATELETLQAEADRCIAYMPTAKSAFSDGAAPTASGKGG